MGQVDGALFPGMTVGSDRGVDVANRALVLIWAFTRAHARARADRQNTRGALEIFQY